MPWIDMPIVDHYHIDTRPIIDDCPVCGQPFHGEDSTHYGDDGYHLDGYYIHDDCIKEYLEQYKIGG